MSQCLKVDSVTPKFFLNRLEQRVSQYDARLILNSALVVSGLKIEMDAQLDADNVKSLCLAMIKRGGPAYQVGTSVYREVLQ